MRPKLVTLTGHWRGDFLKAKNLDGSQPVGEAAVIFHSQSFNSFPFLTQFREFAALFDFPIFENLYDSLLLDRRLYSNDDQLTAQEFGLNLEHDPLNALAWCLVTNNGRALSMRKKFRPEIDRLLRSTGPLERKRILKLIDNADAHLEHQKFVLVRKHSVFLNEPLLSRLLVSTDHLLSKAIPKIIGATKKVDLPRELVKLFELHPNSLNTRCLIANWRINLDLKSQGLIEPVDVISSDYLKKWNSRRI